MPENPVVLSPNTRMRKRIQDGIVARRHIPDADASLSGSGGSPTPSENGNRDPQTGDKRSRPDDFDEPEFSFSRDNSLEPHPRPPPPPPATRPAVSFNYPAFANTVTLSKRRSPEHSAELLSFANARDPEREVLLYDTLLEVSHLLRLDRYDNENWTMPKDVKDNIRQYTQAVILAPMLPTYSPDAKDIMNLLTEKSVFPATWTQFPSRLGIIRSYVQSCATNARSDLKEAIKDSIKHGTCLSALCDTIVDGTELKVTAALRHRVAWLRFLHANNRKETGNGFYAFVDKQLVLLRADTNNSATELAFAMTQYTTDDEEVYKVGNEKTYTLWTDGQLPVFQVAANKTAKAIVPPVPKN